MAYSFLIIREAIIVGIEFVLFIVDLAICLVLLLMSSPGHIGNDFIACFIVHAPPLTALG